MGTSCAGASIRSSARASSGYPRGFRRISEPTVCSRGSSARYERLIVLCFAEVGVASRKTGGPYLYARWIRAPHRLRGRMVMWLARGDRLRRALTICSSGTLGYFIRRRVSAWGARPVIAAWCFFLTLATSWASGQRQRDERLAVGKLIPHPSLHRCRLVFLSVLEFLAGGAPGQIVLLDGHAPHGVRVQWLRGCGRARRRSPRPGAPPYICAPDGDCCCRVFTC